VSKTTQRTPGKTITTIEFDDGQLVDLQRIALLEHCRISRLVRIACGEYISGYEPRAKASNPSSDRDTNAARNAQAALGTSVEVSCAQA
jgi:hypothetical protein